jgi:hypothetical protein
MDIKSLNKKHQVILELFVKEIEGFIYRITEDQKFGAYNNFQPVISNAKQLHNNIGGQIENMNIDESEWAYMFPNYLLFAGIGFASAIKTKENEDYINDETEDLFILISETICELEEMINERKFVKNKKDALLKNIIKQTKDD